MKMKLLIKIFLIIFITILASGLIYLGIRLNKEADPLIITTAVLDKAYDNISSFFKTNNLFEDKNFTYTTNLNVTSVNNNENVKLNANYQLLKSLSTKIIPCNLDMSLIQDNNSKKLFLQSKEVYGNETLNGKLLLENATEYYFVDKYTPTYINNGTNNYFESLSKKATLNSNLNYLKDFIYTSFKNNLKEEYFTEYDDTIYLNQKEEKVKRITLKFTDDVIKKIKNDILKDLRNDSKATLILEGYDKDFKKKKYDFSSDNEAIISLNIYVDKWFNKVKKVELVNLIENDESRISFEKEGSKNLIYIISNAKIDEYLEIKKNKITIFNSSDKNIGSVDIEKNGNDKLINFYLNDENNHLEIFYEDKYSKKDNNYENSRKLNIKLSVKKMDIIDLAISSTNTYEKNATIDEVVNETTLESSLDETIKDKMNSNLESKFLKLIRRQ